MSLIADLKYYGVTLSLDGDELKINGLDKVKDADRQVVAKLIKEAQSDKQRLIEKLKGSLIYRSYSSRININKAFINGDSLENITELLIKCVSDLTGDKAFEIQNIKALLERKANGR